MFQMKNLLEIIISRKTTEPKQERGRIKKSYPQVNLNYFEIETTKAHQRGFYTFSISITFHFNIHN